MTNLVPDFQVIQNGLTLPLNVYKQVEVKQISYFDNHSDYIQINSITDKEVKRYHMVYKDKSISKEDIFYYVYGFLYSPSIELNLVLERKPRSVWNARPVKDNVAQELLEWGKLLPGGNKEMVKLLRLCVDYGQDKILGIKKLIPSGVIPTVDLIRSYLVPPASPAVLHLKNELEIDSVDLSAYDRKFGMVAEQ